MKRSILASSYSTVVVAGALTGAVLCGCSKESGETAELDEESQLLGYNEVGRYQVYPNPRHEGMRMHFLVDSALGRAWVGFIPASDTEMFPRVQGWVPVRLQPEPKIEFPELGRFVISSSMTYGMDQFLVDTALGHVYCAVTDDRGSIIFEQLPVEGLEVVPSAEPTK